MRPRLHVLAIFAVVLLASMGCRVFQAQHSRAMWERTRPTPMAAAPTDGTLGFARIQDEILTPRCAIPECHVTPPPDTDEAAPEGLILEKGKSYDLIVGVRAAQRDLFRIEPGNPADSYLYRKVTPDLEISWHRMPLEGERLTTEELKLLHDWIMAGAPR